MGSSSCDTEMFEVTLGAPQYPVTVKLPLTIPSIDDPAELAHRVLQHHNLPIFMHQDLTDAIGKFLIDATTEKHKKEAEAGLAKLRNRQVQIDEITQFWEPDPQVCPDVEEDLPALYHRLVHSSSGGQLLQLEHQYSTEVATLVDKRDSCIAKLDEKQNSELILAVSRSSSDAQVNAVTARHLEASELACAEWDSAISGLKEQQLRNFRAMLRDGQVAGHAQAVLAPCSVEGPMMEESFTIHLGTQMKQMHNLRLIAADAMDLCHYSGDNGDELPPQRIQTSLQLYGRNLHGLVIMVDNRISSYSGIKKEFGSVCSRATELHFPELCRQLDAIRDDLVPTVASWRLRRARPQHREDGDSSEAGTGCQQLQAGDVYVTRHSNLSSVHVVFHVVCDDSVRSSVISSRHPVILGLRNVLKVACLCSVTTLSLPLLLSNELSEDMSVPWCLRRAELVYKCVKGFMMEMTSWGGSEMNTLQFMLPKNISEAQFQSLSAMLPSIFRVSNPLVVSQQPSVS